MSDDTKKKSSKRDRDEAYDEAFDDGFGDDFDDQDEHLFDEAEFEAEGWSIPRDPESVARVLKSLENLVPDVLKRSAQEAQGEEGDASAESLRSRLSDRKLPREVVSFILGQVDTTKREFLRILSREIRLFLENMDLGGELAKILTSLSFEVRMEVRFIPNDQALKPSARGRMRVKRTRSAGRDDQTEESDDQEGIDEETGDDEESSKRRRWSLRRKGKDEEKDEESEEDESPEE